jgi:TPR repeat protein
MPKACPRCGDAHSRKSASHSSDGLLRTLLYSPYRCRACRYRFWQLNPVKPLALIGVLALAIFIGWWIPNLDREPAAVSTKAANAAIAARAQQGDPDAELQMGLRYADGSGVIKDEKEAARWFEKAARHNLAEAQYRYGLALLEGRGVVQDYKAAFNWIEQPARRGHPRAQYKLGELYRYGTGTEHDKARAYLWFNLAAAQGLEAAAKARDSLAWQLESGQLSAMQTEARKLSRPAPETPQSAPANPPKPRS